MCSKRDRGEPPRVFGAPACPGGLLLLPPIRRQLVRPAAGRTIRRWMGSVGERVRAGNQTAPEGGREGGGHRSVNVISVSACT